MPFRFTHRIERQAMTVPYGPIRDEIRDNRGFVDIRGRPDKAREILEGKDSPALGKLLVRLAAPGSPIFTLGCDLGSHREPTNVPARRREVAGGYIQFASIHYDRAGLAAYGAFGNAIIAFLKTQVGEDNWKIDFVGQGVNFQFDDKQKGIFPSLWLWLFAAARDPFSAVASRERLIQAIDSASALPAALDSFASAVEPK